MKGALLTATGKSGPLFAAVVPTARFVEAAVSGSRLGAHLRPFTDETAARKALAEAGGEQIKEGK